MDFSHIRNYLFIALLGGVTILFLWLLKPFAYPIFWAAVIAALFYPAFSMIEKRLKNHSVSAFFSVLIIMLIIIIPLFVVTALVVKETINLYNGVTLHSGVNETALHINAFFKNNPVIKFFNIDQALVNDWIAKITNTIATTLISNITAITQNSLEFVAMFIVMLYTLFFFLRDGDQLIGKLMYLSPLGSNRERSLYEKFTITASSMIRGTIIIGSIQGLLCGLVLAIAGIDSAVIWGIVTILASIIPGVGAAIVWAPFGIYLLASNQFWQAALVFIVGATLISTIDNFLRPILVGKTTNMHPLLILFSTLGGITLFGISGFLIGPILASLFMTCWEMYEHYFQSELEKN